MSKITVIIIVLMFLGAAQDYKFKQLREKEIKMMERYERMYKNSFRECGTSRRRA